MGYEVTISQLTFRPRGPVSRPVLSNIDLSVQAGETIALVGLNGAGKTTLLRAIAGELPPESLVGLIRVGGTLIDRPIAQRINRVGVVHQSDNADLIEHLTVGHNIAIRQILARTHKGRLWTIDEAWATQCQGLLASTAPGLDAGMGDLVRDLAGGTRQMLSVATAVFLEHNIACELLLLDEHTSRLDHRNASRVMAFTTDIIKRAQTTTIMATHRYEDALKYSTRIAVLADGKVHRVLDDLTSLDVRELALIIERAAMTPAGSLSK